MKRFILFLLMSVLPALAQHSNTLSWQWTQGTGGPATGFRVKRANVPGPYTAIATLIGTATTTYIDTSVLAGETHYYVVVAYNDSGESPASGQVIAVTPSQSQPLNSPTLLTAIVR